MNDVNDETTPRPIAVIGSAVANDALTRQARAVGEAIARAGHPLVCGGRGGVMAAASEGARAAGGMAIGLLPGVDASASPPNPHLSVTLFTGLGQARNLAVVLSAGAAIAIGGGWGTLSEIALARKHQIPVILLDSWQLRPPDRGLADLMAASTPLEAVRLARDAMVRE